MFRNRDDAGHQLALKLKDHELHDPLVLAIPRGGVVTGAALAKDLGAELDIVLSRKLRAPGQPEFAIGAIAEDGEVYLSEPARHIPGLTVEYLAAERHHQLAEIALRGRMFRRVRPRAPVANRSVIVTDDGIATGSTMIAALRVIEERNPREVIVAAPVCSADRLNEIRFWCDDLVCLLEPEDFWAVGQFYEDFRPVTDEMALALLRNAACRNAACPHGTPVHVG